VAFGQQSGPPASAKQVAYLLALVKQAGHEGFRDARGPLGLTQRQAGGKFTSPEASALIDQLLATEHDADDAGAPPPVSNAAAQRAAARLESQQVDLVRGIPAALLAAELERRGWTVSEP
jgi:hypothetical protein